jgi:RNA polymerase sigma factor (sigma-70 family)
MNPRLGRAGKDSHIVSARHVDGGVQLPPFQTLVDTHGRDIHRFLSAMLCAHDADDCWQETFISALRAYPRLRAADNLRGWLFTIAHRKALDLMRARRAGAVPAGDGLPETPVSDRIPALEEPIWAAVRRLPPKQRAAVTLRYGLDADYALIAGALRCSEPAARRSVHEGLRRLRSEVQR